MNPRIPPEVQGAAGTPASVGQQPAKAGAPAPAGNFAENNGQGQLNLQRSLSSWRTLFSTVLTILTILATMAALVPLVSVVLMLLYRGGAAISWGLFTLLPPLAGVSGGGIGNAILGTLIVVGIASLISVPLGVLGAVYLSEFSGDGRSAEIIRFAAKVLTGLPSILAGVFAYALVVTWTGDRSALAGGVALALLMLPIVMLTAEEALKQVPQRMRDAAFGMGATPTQVVWYIVLPTALPTLTTGVMLAVARAAGETAPLLFTVGFSMYWPSADVVSDDMATLAVLIYKFSTEQPFDRQIELAWAASLVLVVLVLGLNLLGQRLAGKQQR